MSNYSLPEKSQEQALIVAAIGEGNVIVDAVAGSGKTTTILHIGKLYPDLRFLILTYNSRLKEDTRNKIAALGLENMECHSYHAMCVKYYGGHTDTAIKNMLKTDKMPKKRFWFDVIIVDEAQDIKPIFFEFVCKIFKDNRNAECKLAVLGDVYQSIYKFNCADSRYISLADQVFLMNNHPWQSLTLSTSFRVTRQIAAFINECLLKENRIKAVKDGEPVNYIYANMFRLDLIIKEIYSVLRRGYNCDDIFILAPTTKGSENNPIPQLANKLKMDHPDIPVFASLNDEEIYDDRVLAGKIFFSTFHSIKGMERKVVFILGFDSSYYEYYAKNENPSKCPNTIYVATTRPKEILTIFHSKSKDYMPFMDSTKIDGRCRTKYLGCYSMTATKYKHSAFHSKMKDYTVSELLRFTPHKIIDECNTLFSYEQIQERMPRIIVDTMIKTKNDSFECVSDITGVAIPLYAMKKIFKDKFHRPEKYGAIFFNVLQQLEFETYSIQEFLQNAIAIGEKFHEFNFKRMQIDVFDWITEEDADNCTRRIQDVISEQVVIEQPVNGSFLGSAIMGSLDIVDHETKTVWELKCVSELSPEHFIQLALYAVLWNKSNPGFKYKLLNIFDGCIFELKMDFKDEKRLFAILINWKRHGEELAKTDAEFIEECREISERYQMVDDDDRDEGETTKPPKKKRKSNQ